MTKKLLYPIGSGGTQNGKISINEATGEITIDNKIYVLRANIDTGAWELVSADGIVTTLGAALGANKSATLLATIGFADMNAWGAVPNFVLDLAGARPVNTQRQDG